MKNKKTFFLFFCIIGAIIFFGVANKVKAETYDECYNAYSACYEDSEDDAGYAACEDTLTSCENSASDINNYENSSASSCDDGYYKGRDGSCYPNENLDTSQTYDPSTGTTTTNTSGSQTTSCDDGYYKGRDGKCYPSGNNASAGFPISADGQSDIKITKDTVIDGQTIPAGYTIHPGGTATNDAGDTINNVNYNAAAQNATGAVNNSPGTNYSGPKCGDPTQFTEIGGVCFPINTGLPDPQNGIIQILANLLTWLLGIFSIFAVMAFVISGIQYLTSTGDQERLEIAKRNAQYSLLGVLVGLSGFVIFNAISLALSGSTFQF